MTAPSSPPRTAQSNIERVVQLEEEEEERHRSFADRFPEMIGSFAGSVAFVVCQLAFVGLWAVANSEIVPGLPAFDPFPYSLLSGVLGLESVLLTAFVLIRPNRMSLIGDRRSHLDLQISLLAEKETTKIIQMLERMSGQMGSSATSWTRKARSSGKRRPWRALPRNSKKNSMRMSDASEGSSFCKHQFGSPVSAEVHPAQEYGRQNRMGQRFSGREYVPVAWHTMSASPSL